MKRLIAFALSVACVCVMTSCVSAEEKSYQEAVKLRDEGNYEEAIGILQGIQSYQDSSSLIVSSYEALIDESLNNGKNEEAIAYIDKLGEYTDTGDMLSETVYDLYHNGSISLDFAMEYLSAYDLLDDKSRAFVDVMGVWDDDYASEIIGVYHYGYYDEIATDSYIVWEIGSDGSEDYSFIYDDGNPQDGVSGRRSNQTDYLADYYSPDPSYDYELINLAVRGH